MQAGVLHSIIERTGREHFTLGGLAASDMKTIVGQVWTSSPFKDQFAASTMYSWRQPRECFFVPLSLSLSLDDDDNDDDDDDEREGRRETFFPQRKKDEDETLLISRRFSLCYPRYCEYVRTDGRLQKDLRGSHDRDKWISYIVNNEDVLMEFKTW